MIWQKHWRNMTSQRGEGSKKLKNPSKLSYFIEAKKESSYIPQAPFEMLTRYESQVKRLRGGKLIKPSSETTVSTSKCQVLSADSILKLAKLRLLPMNDDFNSVPSPLPFDSSLSCANLKDVELTSFLLNAAERFSIQQFDYAEKLLKKCIHFSSLADNSLERVVKFFAEALQERVDIERGKIDLERKAFRVDGSVLQFHPAILACEERHPSSQITQFTAIQSILESVASAKKIHLLDFGLRNGLHWSVLIQGLATRKNCPLELLKITAVGTSKDRLETAGKLILSFAESLNLTLLYKAVISELKDLNRDLFDLKGDEVVAVYAGLCLWSHLARPSSLKAFIQFVKELNPCVMVVNEIEASTDTSSFIERFHGGLSFSIAMFDSLETCLKGDRLNRKIVEDMLLGEMIRNIVVAEDEERYHRHAKIDFWRNLFAEFDIVEMELSDCSFFQANLLIKSTSFWDSCTLHMDGKCMIVGWKGTPLQSISAWKIHDGKIKHGLLPQ